MLLVRSLSGAPHMVTGLNPASKRVVPSLSRFSSFLAGLFVFFELSDPPVGALAFEAQRFPSEDSALLLFFSSFSGSDSDSALNSGSAVSGSGFLFFLAGFTAVWLASWLAAWLAACLEALGSQKICTAYSQNVSTCSASVLRPSSKEIISDSVVLWLTATCFFAKAFMGIKVFGPTIQMKYPLVLLLVANSSAKLASQ